MKKSTIALILAPALFLLFLASSSPASTERRVALVIGNASYQHAPILANPGNDARGVAAALKRMGFDVSTVQDAGKSALEGKLAAFRGQSRGADLAVLYYAGHAVQIDGRNYIVPVDAEVRELGDVNLRLVTLNTALQQMEGQVNIVILDACRDNPFADDLQRSAARLGRNLGATRGLAREEAALGSGAYLMMAAAPEKMALDGPAGGHSPYTAALLQHLETPGLELRMLHAHVREAVEQSTGRAQSPEAIDRLPPRSIFFAPPSPGQAASPVQPQQPPPVSPEALELAFWQSIQNSQSAADYEAYLRRYPQGTFRDLAQNRVAALRPTPAQPSTTQPPAPQQPAQQVAMAPRPTAPTGPKAGDVWKEPHTGMEFVWVPGGCFQMGCGPWDNECRDNEKPAHEVCVNGFWMGKYEVTQAQWEKVMGTNVRQQRDKANRSWSLRGEGPNHPMYYVSWNEAQEFTRKLNSQSSASGFRLPTEAQWEYACRGGGKQEKYCGGNNVDSVAWYKDNSSSTTHPVGRKSPNALGIYDMSGNVWEWVEDVYDKKAYEKSNRHTNPVVASGGSARVLRGGSWIIFPRLVRSAFRNGLTPDIRNSDVGFRLARTAQD